MQIDKQTRYGVSLFIALALLVGPTAKADNGITTTINGYGTVGGTFTSDNNYAYIHDASEFTGATHQPDIGLNTRLGVQAVMDFGSGISVTVQEVARQRGNNAFSLGTEWLYLQYAPNSDWKFRLGRVALATFLFSDSRNVTYAAPWLNMPNEIYAAESFQTLDGAQIVWHHNVGAVGLGLEGSYGKSTETYLNYATGVPGEVKVKSMYNVAGTLEYGNFLVRLAQTTFQLPSELPLSPTYSLAFTVTDTFNSAGLQYDNGKAIVLAEYAKRTENNVPFTGLPAIASSQWYVAGGWRFGKSTPLLSYATYQPRTSLLVPAGKFSTPSFSWRYDIVANVALKAQVSRAQSGNDYYWVKPNLASPKRVYIFSLGADFVF